AQPRGGNTPCNAMQKLSVRKGCMLLCGRLPPTSDTAGGGCGSWAVLARGAEGLPRPDLANAPPAPPLGSPATRPGAAKTLWVCDGISVCSSVTVSDPPVSPRSCSDSPGPWPGCIGARPCRLGSAKFDFPSPP